MAERQLPNPRVPEEPQPIVGVFVRRSAVMAVSLAFTVGKVPLSFTVDLDKDPVGAACHRVDLILEARVRKIVGALTAASACGQEQ